MWEVQNILNVANMTEILINAVKKQWDSDIIAPCSFTLQQLYLRERVPSTHWGEGWLDAKASLNSMARINGPWPGRETDSCSPASLNCVLFGCIQTTFTHTHTHTHTGKYIAPSLTVQENNHFNWYSFILNMFSWLRVSI